MNNTNTTDVCDFINNALDNLEKQGFSTEEAEEIIIGQLPIRLLPAICDYMEKIKKSPFRNVPPQTVTPISGI